MARKISGLKQLGAKTPQPKSPAEAVLERVPNPHPYLAYVARFTAPEFTCLCPVTGQPDFAHFVIDYAPREWLLELKSLKLYLASFRNIGAFHEDATVTVGKRIVALIDPAWLRIGGLLVSARRHPDRRVLAARHAARRRLDPRAGCYALSRPRLRRALLPAYSKRAISSRGDRRRSGRARSGSS